MYNGRFKGETGVCTMASPVPRRQQRKQAKLLVIVSRATATVMAKQMLTVMLSLDAQNCEVGIIIQEQVRVQYNNKLMK